MPMINTNISSLYSQMHLGKTERMLDQATERLASGSKLNTAADDAAGMAISTRMTSQVQGLRMAVKNAGDGLSLLNSVEGALDEVTNMLQRIRELAVQSVNDTNSGADRLLIQHEVNQLIAEITRVSTNTRFNGDQVLNGTLKDKSFQLGTESGETVTFTVDSVKADALGAYTVTGTTRDSLGVAAAPAVNTTTDNEDIIVHGNTVSETIGVAAQDSAYTVKEAINAVSGNTGVTAKSVTYAELLSSAATATYSIKINGTSTGNFSIGSASVADAVTKINQISGTTGVTATSAANGGSVFLYDSEGHDMTIENETALANLDVFARNNGNTARAGAKEDLAVAGGNDATRVVGSISLSSSKSFSVTQSGTAALGYFAASANGVLQTVANVNVKSSSGAASALATLDGAIEKVNFSRSELGALQNRLTHTIDNLTNIYTNTEASVSRIVDADFALETAKLTTAQVLQQAGTAMLAQSNQAKQTVLALLGP